MANKFVDYSAANNGDGTAANQASGAGAAGAYNTVVGMTINVGDVFWFRRTSTTLTLSSVAQTFTIAGVSYIGWPIPSDVDYSTRPTSGTTNGWDADSVSNLPTITYAGTTTVIVSTGVNQVFKRLKFNDPTNANHITVSNTISVTYTNCTFISGTAATAANGAVNDSSNSTFTNCTITCQGARFGFNNTAGISTLTDCIFTKTAQAVAGAMLNVGLACNVTRCSFATQTAGNTATTCILNAGSVLSTFIDCTLDNSIANAAGEYAYVDTTGISLIRNMSVKGTGVKLTLVTRYQLRHFSSIIQTFSQATGALQIVTSFPAIIVIDNFVPKTGNTNDITTVEGALILIRNGAFLSATPVTGNQFPGVYVAHNAGTLGAFKHFGPNGTVVSTTSVTRTGGEAFSLKFVNTAATYPAFVPLDIGKPGMESIFCSLVAGTNNITLYGAYTTFTTAAPIAEDIWFEIEYLDQSTGAHRGTKSCRAAGTLTTDTSTWLGATVTKFKLVATVTTGQACVAPVRIHSKYLDATGVIYLDPRPVVS